MVLMVLGFVSDEFAPSSAVKTALDAEGGTPEPDYEAPIQNVTVALGREAKLSCVVNNLGGYRVRCS